MKAKDITKRIFIAFMALAMTVTYMPAAAFAAPLEPQGQPAAEESDGSAESQAEESAEEAQDETENTAGEEASEAEDAKAFTREAEADGVIVKVEAGAGAFPENAELSVEKVSKKEEAKAGKAVEEARPDKVNVADSYTFDIRILDAEGNELQPADGEKVNVSFSMARVADKNLSADVYHITEKEVTDKKTKETKTVLEAERLDAETNRKEETVAAETGGFSLYTVEFTYGELQYVMKGSGKVRAATVLKSVGLVGEIEDISVSNEELFSASKESGEWVIESHKPFKTEEWMKVTINGVVYEIVVTDAEGDITVGTWADMQNAINAIEDGKTIVLQNDLIAGSGDKRFAVTNGKKFTIDLAGHTINRNLSSKDEDDGHIFDVGTGTVTIKSSAEGAKLTGGYDENGGGIVIGGNGALTIENVEISGNHASEDGAGIYVYGKLNMTDGVIENNTSKSGGAISVHSGGQIELTNVTMQNNTASKWGGGAINNKGTAKLTKCTITGNKAGNEGGGIYQGSKTLELNNCTITGNSSPAGGGICCFGTVTTNNTSIDNNTANNDGGGLAVHGKLNMTGGSVSGNKAEDGGGIYNTGGEVDISEVTISGNTATKYGGAGLNNKNEGTANVNYCTFEGNKARETGGAIYASEDIKIIGCKFNNNHSDTCGGAIRMYDCAATIIGCEMNGNTANEHGGSIYVDNDGTARITSTEITGSVAYKSGSGIYVGSKGNLGMIGVNKITGNTASDVFLVPGKKINVMGELSEDGKNSQIGIVLEDKGGVFTSKYKEANGDRDPYEFFIPETGFSVVLDGDEAKIITSLWGNLQHKIDIAENNSVINLDRSIKAQADDRTLTIPSGKNITINLNGFTLDRGLGEYKEAGEAITVNGNLTITDTKGGGKVTGGFGEGGGVCVNNGANFTLEGGSITGNKGNATGGGVFVLEGGSATIKKGSGAEAGKVDSNSAPNGGGIYSAGTLTVQNSASIAGNSASKSGGGIYVASGETTVTSGDITSNSAAAGGGVYIGGGSLNLRGGKIADNTASDEAGGIWHGADGGNLKVQGAPKVKDNTSTTGMNIILRSGKTMNITGELTTDGSGDANAALDLMTDSIEAPMTSGLTTSKPEGMSADEYAKKVFTYNGNAYEDALEVRNNELYHKPVQSDVQVSDWQALQNAINNSTEGQVIALEKDIDASNDNWSIKVDRKNVVVELNGHKMDRKRDSDTGDGHVFNVKNGGTLTIRDSVGTGILTGGNATDGGGIKIEKNSTCIIESGTIKGNKADKDGGGIYVWGTLKMTGGIITGNYADDDGGGIYVEDTGSLDIDGAMISDNKAKKEGAGLNINAAASIKNSTFKDNRSDDSDGGGIYMDAHGKTLTIENTRIQGSYADGDGGGIYLQSGTINMTGGELSGSSGNDAGGIMVTSNTTFSASGVSITDNNSRKESGGGVNNKGKTTLTDCNISNNKASKDSGGGVYNKSDLTMTGCTLTGNRADSKGGAVFSKDKAEIANCTFDSNTSGDHGGGIYHGDGNMTLIAPVMTNNKSEGQGGAIYADDVMTIDGGSITENNGDFGGSGIYVNDEVTIKGALVVTNNAIDNVFLNDEKLIVDSGLEGSRIGVRLDDKSGTFTKGYKAHNTDQQSGHAIDPIKYFFSDEGYSVIKDGDEEAKIVESEWPQLQQLINETAKKDVTGDDIPVLKLQKDWKASSGDRNLTMPVGSSIIIDLNGYTIDRNRSSKDDYGHVFTIDQDNALVIRDTSEAKTGTITGGWSDQGGAFYLAEHYYEYDTGARLTIEGGNITGNKADNGAAIYARGGRNGDTSRINITGGTITGNEASNGGAIYLVDENESDFDIPAEVNITGGVITGNRAIVEGGAIWAGERGTVNVSGRPVIVGNEGPVGQNILLGEGNVLNITDELTVGSGSMEDTAKIDLMTKIGEGKGTGAKLTSGLTDNTPEGKTPEAYAEAIFTYNGQSYESALEVKENELYRKNVELNVDEWVSDWKDLQDYVNNSDNRGKTVGLSKDIDATGEDYSIKVDGDNVSNITIELNGHKMDRKRSSSKDDGHVIVVKDKATLTIKDSIGTGIITGGNTSDNGGGIKIEKNSTCIIQGGTISGNKAEPDGGGIYVKGTLIMNGGTVSGNYADDTGGGIYCTDSGTFRLENATIAGNTSENDGGGLIVHLGKDVDPDSEADAIIKNCRIIDNVSKTEDGGGMRVECKNRILQITDTEISGNTADGDGGGMVIYAGKVIMNGGLISKNTALDGGGVYNNDGSIDFYNVKIDGNTSTEKGGAGLNNRNNAYLKDCEITNNVGKEDGAGIYAKHQMTVEGGKISGNISKKGDGGIYNTDDGTQIIGTEISGNKAEKDGGAIFSDNDMILTGCTIKENFAKVSGGAIRIKDSSMELNNCTISDNSANSYGGGIYIDDGSAEMTLNGGSITGNLASLMGSGIYVDDGTDDVYIKGAVNISGNLEGSDVYLTEDEVLEVTGPLSGGEGSTVRAHIGVITEEGLDTAFTKNYINHNDGIEPAEIFYSNDDYDVYLKDGKEAAFKAAEKKEDPNPFIEKNSQMDKDYNGLTGKNWMSGISGERYLHEINIPGTHDSCTKDMEGNTSTGKITEYAELVPGLLGPVGSIAEAIMYLFTGDNLGQKVADYMARYSKTQTRYVNEQLVDGIRSLDLRVNTYYSKSGAEYNRNDDGKNLWVLHGKDEKAGSYFAKKENGDFMNLKDVFGYCKEFLEKHPTETIVVDIAIQGIDVDWDLSLGRLNDHIRDLSQEINPATGESFLYMEDGDYTKVLTSYPQLKDCRGKIVLMGDTVGQGTGGLKKGVGLANVYGPEGDYHDNSDQKIKHLKDFYAVYGHDPIPVDGNNGNPTLDYYYSVGTNCTDSRQIPVKTPLDYAEKVLPVLFDEGGLLTDRQSKYLGLVNMDGANAKNNRQVWITNFGTLEYCTVVAKESENDPNPKTYTVLTKTPITIPECIYDDPNADGDYFQCWKATDKDGKVVGMYYPGDSFTVTEDVTFTAVWEKTQPSSVYAVWNDADDADGFRPNKVTVKVTKKQAEGETGDPETEIITLTADGKAWRENLDYEVSKVEPTNPDKYTSEVKATKIIFTHVPEKTVKAAGTITWNDNNDEAKKRPDSVSLYLYKDDELFKGPVNVSADDWAYDLGDLPLYEEKDGKIRSIAYTLKQSEVDDYSTYVSGLKTSGDDQGFTIKNTLKSSTASIEGVVVWADDDNKKDIRPKEVTVHLLAGGEEIGTQKVSKGSDGDWLFSFPVDPDRPYTDYSVTIDKIEGYDSSVNMGGEEGGYVVITNKLVDHEHKLYTISQVTKEATCEEEGEEHTLEFCLTCGEVVTSKTEKIPALGHDWGEWNTKRAATETEDGLEERVCSRDPSHVESRVVPKKTHEHKSVKVNAKAPTCTTDGNIAYYYCSECGWYYIDPAHPAVTWIAHGDEVVPATGHDWGEWTVVKEPTETEPGTEERVCKHDKAHKETRKIPPKDHEHGLEHFDAKEPTCTEDGNIEYWVCTGGDHPCGLYYSDSEGKNQISADDTVIPATGHEMGKWKTVTPATETQEGLEKRTCKHEGCEYKEERTIPKTLHEHEPVFVPSAAPTCTMPGNKAYYYCEGCGWYFIDGAHPGTTWIAHGDEVIPATGHDWGAWEQVRPVTKDEDGLERRICNNDDAHVQTRKIPRVLHVHKPVKVNAKDPTCTEDGNIAYYRCDECGWYFIDGAHPGTTWIAHGDEVIPATGHDWSEWVTVTPATTDEDGLEKRVCKNDPDHEQTRKIPRTLHVHKPVRIEAKAPTCTEEGNIAYYYCEECGWYFLDGAHPGTTWIAHGDEVIPIDPYAHAWGPWKETKAPTDTEEGEEERTCSRCGEVDVRTIPKVDPSKVSYRVTEGDGQTWYRDSRKTADFTFKRSVDDKSTFSHFTGIKVDGEKVSAGNYTKESGSVVIKLKPRYLQKLENGRHTLTAEFDDGSAEATFIVADNGSGGGSGRGGAGTGDSSGLLSWLAVLLSAALALTMTAGYRRKKIRP